MHTPRVRARRTRQLDHTYSVDRGFRNVHALAGDDIFIETLGVTIALAVVQLKM